MWRSLRPTWGAMMITSSIGFRQCASSCRTILNDTQGYIMTWRTVTFWVRKIGPKHPTAAFDILGSYKNLAPQCQAHKPTRSVTFVHCDDTASRKTVPVNDEIPFADVTCYHFQEMGHYVGNGLSSRYNAHMGSQLLQVVPTTTQTTDDTPETDIINPDLILLDTWSTIISVRNRYLVQDIHACDTGR